MHFKCVLIYYSCSQTGELFYETSFEDVSFKMCSEIGEIYMSEFMKTVLKILHQVGACFWKIGQIVYINMAMSY